MKKFFRFIISSNKFLSLLPKKKLKVLENLSKKQSSPFSFPKMGFLGPNFVFGTNFIFGNEKEPTRFLCAVSGGQDSILSFFLLFHIISPKSFDSLPHSQKLCFWERDQQIIVPFTVHSQKFILVPKTVAKPLLVPKTEFLEKGKVTGQNYFWKQKIDKMSALEVVYCQHFWQPKNFFCSQLIFQTSFQIQVPYSFIFSTKSLVSENRSRVWRKKSFYRFLQLQKISTLVTGYTQSDRIEQNLSNFFRGTSPKSLENPAVFNSKKINGMFFSTLIFETRSFQYERILKSKIVKNHFLFKPQKKKRTLFVFEKHIGTFFKNPVFGTKSVGPFSKNFVFGTNFIFGKGKETKLVSLKSELFTKNALVKKNTFVFFCSPKKVVKNQFRSFRKNEIRSFPKKNLFWTKTVWSPKHSFGERKGKRKTDFKNNLFRNNCKKKSFSLPFIQISKPHRFKEEHFVFFYSSTPLIINLGYSINPGFSSSFFLVSKPLKNKVVYLKPLETINRLTVSKFVNLSHYPITRDMTNFSANFYRNKIRHLLIPFIRVLFQKKIEYLLTRFFSLVTQEHQQIENKLSELNRILKFIRGKSFKNKNSIQLFQKSIKISSSIILKNKIGLKGALMKNTILSYRELDLNFLQTSKLQTFVE